MTKGLVIDVAESTKKNFTWNEKEVELFRRLVIRESRLVCPKDDIFLLSFLRARKFDKERAIKLLKNYYSTRKNYSETFHNFNPSSVQKFLEMNIMGYLSRTDQNGRIIGIGRASNWNPSLVHIKDILKCLLVLLDMLLTTQVMQVNGISIILDAKGLSWRHIIQLTPGTAYQIACTLFGSSQVRYKEIHVVNVTAMANAFLSALIPFLPYKIQKRIHFHHHGMESLHKFIHPEYLPADYGGYLSYFDPKESNQKLKEYEHYFRECEKYWRNEKPKHSK